MKKLLILSLMLTVSVNAFALKSQEQLSDKIVSPKQEPESKISLENGGGSNAKYLCTVRNTGKLSHYSPSGCGSTYIQSDAKRK